MYEHVLTAFYGSVWAITEEKWEALAELLALRAGGLRLSDGEIAARIGPPRPAPPEASGIAVLNLFGVMSQRANMLTDSSGGTSTEAFGAAFDEVVRAPGVSAVVLNVDSPGGSVYGLQELAQKVYRARGRKPVVAVANSTAASAAYWVASAADELAVAPGGEVGSIGVFAVHRDESARNEKDGVKHTVVKAGKYKAEGIPEQPLSAEAADYLQGRADEYYQAFVEAVAKHRNTTPGAVKNGYGEGRVVGAKRAVELGMADRVATLEQVLRDLQGRTAGPRRSLSVLKRRLDLQARG